jgi:hypothetical protein
MNNTMCLGLFLLVVHSRGLNWDFTSEVIVTVGEPRAASTHACCATVSAQPSEWAPRQHGSGTHCCSEYRVCVSKLMGGTPCFIP